MRNQPDPGLLGALALALVCTQIFPVHAWGDPKLPPQAAPGFTVLGGLGLLPAAQTAVDYGGWFTPEQDPGEIEQHRVTVQLPVYRDGKNAFSFSVGGTSLHFGGDENLSGSGIAVPVDLWKIEAGGSYSHQIDEDKFSGARISLGSASDHPFADLGVTTVGASAFYSWSTSLRSRWLLTVFFSNNNPIINYVPIPGFIYLYRSETFEGMFGLPFSAMTWTPQKPLMLTLSFFGPTIRAEIACGNPRNVEAFTGFSWIQQSYLRENRPDPNDRLYFDEKRVPLGIRFPVLSDLQSELSVGYAFDRSFYEGIHFLSQEDGGVSLGNSWLGEWNLRLKL